MACSLYIGSSNVAVACLQAVGAISWWFSKFYACEGSCLYRMVHLLMLLSNDQDARALGLDSADDEITIVDTTLRLTPQLVLSDCCYNQSTG